MTAAVRRAATELPIRQLNKLAEALGSHNGPSALARHGIVNAVPTAVHAEHYGRIVERKAVLRNLIGAAGKIAAVGYEEANDAEVAIDRAESILFEISQRRTAQGFESLGTLLGQAYDRLEYLHEHRGQILGIPSGLSQLDTLLGGFQPSDLIILAARPSMGKTALAANIAEHVAINGKTTTLFMLLGVIAPDSGHVEIAGRPLTSGIVAATWAM